MDFTKDSIEPMFEVDHDSVPVRQCASPLSQTGSDSDLVVCSETVQELSAWEKWIIKKALVDRAKAEQEKLLLVSSTLSVN